VDDGEGPAAMSSTVNKGRSVSEEQSGAESESSMRWKRKAKRTPL
jgi:hypothetical protein